MHHLSFLSFIPLSLFPVTILTIIIIFYFTIIKLLLSQPTGFTFVWFSSPSHGEREREASKQLCGTQSPTGIKPQHAVIEGMISVLLSH